MRIRVVEKYLMLMVDSTKGKNMRLNGEKFQIMRRKAIKEYVKGIL